VKTKLFTIFVPNQDFTIQHLVVPENIVQHSLIQVLRGSLECDLHATCFLLLQIYIASIGLVRKYIGKFFSMEAVRWLSVKSNTHCFKLAFEQSSLLRPLRCIKDHEDQITCLRHVSKIMVHIIQHKLEP